jgi:putative serine protease PepD
VTFFRNDAPTTPPAADEPAPQAAGRDAEEAHAGPAETEPDHEQPPAPGRSLPPTGEPAVGAGEPSLFAAPTPPPPPPRTFPPPSQRGSGARVAMIAVVMIALVGAGYVGRGLVDADDTSQTALVDRNLLDDLAGQGQGGNASTPLLPGTDGEPVKAVAKALGPSVVVIRNGEGLGSGVVYDSSGLILTNAHVVGSSTGVTVTLNDGTTLAGTVVGADPATDVAVVRVPQGDLPAARMAGQPPELGDLVVALGSPFGLDQTITSGIVSAVSRPVDNGAGGYVNMVQTDAAINPGNSGGALANRFGEVMGIPSMIYSRSGDSSGIGFAVPIAKARAVADRIVSGQSLDSARLGVTTKPTDDGMPGAQVVSVAPGTAADQAGLAPGDVIVGIDAEVVKDQTDLAGAIAAHEPGDDVVVRVQRDGQQHEVHATLGAAPPAPADPSSRGRSPRGPGTG